MFKLGGVALLLFGVSTGWPSPTIPILLSGDFPVKLTLEEASYLPVISALSLSIGSVVCAQLINIFGRKFCMILLAVPYFICYLIIIYSDSLVLLYVARVLSGFADGFVTVSAPSYLGEITTPKVRGVWGNLVSVLFYAGELIVNAIGAYYSIRLTAIIMAIIPVIYFVMFTFMPESPYFYLMKGRENDAKVTLKKLLLKEMVDEEFAQLKSDVQRQITEKGTFLEIFMDKVHRKALFIGAYVRIVQCFSGIYAFVTYTKYFFKNSGSNLSANMSTVTFYSVLVLTNLLTTFMVNKIGRRISIITSCTVCTICLVIESVYFYLQEHTSFNLSSLTWFPLFWMIIYLIGYSLGLGVLPTVMTSELFSASIKNHALLALGIFFAIKVIITVKIFDILVSNFGLSVVFAFFAICTFINLIVCIFVIPETKNKTLEEIQQELKDSVEK